MSPAEQYQPYSLFRLPRDYSRLRQSELLCGPIEAELPISNTTDWALSARGSLTAAIEAGQTHGGSEQWQEVQPP